MDSSSRTVTFRSISLPRSIDLDGFTPHIARFKQHIALLRQALCGLNWCGIVILFISLCVLQSKVSAASLGLLWWTLFIHMLISTAWSLDVFAPELSRWSNQLEALQLFKLMSALLLMLLCDRSRQISAWPSTGTVKLNGAANGTLAGGIICLLAFLPYLVDKIPPHTPREPETDVESHRLVNDDVGKPQAYSEPRRSQPSNPEMSFVDLSTPLDSEQTRIGHDGSKLASSDFRAYNNPMNMANSEAQGPSPVREEDKDDIRIQPALMPQVYGYRTPPPDLPPSPSARVCTPAASQSIPKAYQASGALSSDYSTKIAAGQAHSLNPAVPPTESKPATPLQCEGDTATMPIQPDLRLADETQSTGKAQQPHFEMNASQQPSYPHEKHTFVPPEQPMSPLSDVSSSQPFQPSTVSECSMAVQGAGQSLGVSAADPKVSSHTNLRVQFPDLPVLASNPLADSQEHESFSTPKASLPTANPGAGLKSAAFLNQGDSEDSDGEFDF